MELQSLIVNQFYLKRRKAIYIYISTDQGKWIQFREQLCMRVPGGSAVQMIIKEMDGVGFKKNSSSPASPELDKEKREGYLYFLLEPH